MEVYEVPTSQEISTDQVEERICGFNCNMGFGAGIIIAMVGPLPGPT